MAFRDFPKDEPGIQLLQRSLSRGRLGHAYLFTGHSLDGLEAVARTLAKVLNCRQPVKDNGTAVDCCDQCVACRKIDHDNHADVFWVRPESRSRQIQIGQLVPRENSPPRVLLDFVNLKPTESQFKVGIIVAADRMNEQAANAFLKTLEEPPAQSVLILLTTDPTRLLETILSRCLRLSFGETGPAQLAAADLEWLNAFASLAAGSQKTLFGRYRLLDLLLRRLAGARQQIESLLKSRSLLEKYPDADQELRDQWEEELKAAIEAEYRRQRADTLALVQRWLREVWLHTLFAQSALPDGSAAPGRQELLGLPQVAGTAQVARRLTPPEAAENLELIEELQRWLHSNVQEALALEVTLLKLHL